jgi:hypothetical protein
MTEIELITKALNDAYKFIKEQKQTKETGELLINLFKAEILVKNCSIPAVSRRSEQLFCDCEIKGSSFQLNTGEICCCKCEKERAK